MPETVGCKYSGWLFKAFESSSSKNDLAHQVVFARPDSTDVTVVEADCDVNELLAALMKNGDVFIPVQESFKKAVALGGGDYIIEAIREDDEDAACGASYKYAMYNADGAELIELGESPGGKIEYKKDPDKMTAQEKQYALIFLGAIYAATGVSITLKIPSDPLEIIQDQ